MIRKLLVASIAVAALTGVAACQPAEDEADTTVVAPPAPAPDTTVIAPAPEPSTTVVVPPPAEGAPMAPAAPPAK